MLSTLCRQCGLCCSGAFFTHVALSTAEAERLRGERVRVVSKRDGRKVMALGCTALDGTTCGIYGQRPHGCREYVCEVGRSLERGALSLDEALAVVRRGRELVDAVLVEAGPSAPGDTEPALDRARREGLPNGPGPLRAMSAYLAEHF